MTLRSAIQVTLFDLRLTGLSKKKVLEAINN